uniref:Uncharacterized protein n=1 Tax=Rhizophora mucronata TaxID=61149 RepID=A0A2P2PPE1_RHIMU
MVQNLMNCKLSVRRKNK